ncbi:hypothetical protein TcWFU_003538 [Taenia crassiceps]|uniref:Pseudouridylate synthase RPUSD4, mitochondrial n=1 Tax=Taenia crassiceps TaxID=6207 RepID=A0ABR4QQQ1_9CEST
MVTFGFFTTVYFGWLYIYFLSGIIDAFAVPECHIASLIQIYEPHSTHWNYKDNFNLRLFAVEGHSSCQMPKKASSGANEVTPGEESYIDSLFFEPLPKVSKRVVGYELTEMPVDLNVEENGYIDQSYFQDPKTSAVSDLEGTESVADCITGVREQLSINQYSGGKLDFKHQEERGYRVRYDSKGFRVPDDDPIKFHLLTEDEAAEVLYRSIIAVQENLLVINKPPGIACHGGQGQHFSVDSLLPRLAHKIGHDPYGESNNLQLIHRIDKEATGILLISRNQDTYLKLAEAFANRWIRKSYLCITSGIPREKEGSIYLPISEKQINGVYRMVAHRPRSELRVGGDALRDEVEEVENLEKVRKTTNAITHFNIIDRRNDAALLECCSVTGIKHQIRVHLSAALGTPILGDHKYAHFGYLAPQRLSKRTLEALGIRQSKARYLGLHLHAHSIKFGDVTAAAITPSSAPPSQPPPGFFTFLSRDRPRGPRMNADSVVCPLTLLLERGREREEQVVPILSQMTSMSGEGVETESVRASRRIFAERIRTWCTEGCDGRAQTLGRPPLRCLTRLELGTAGLRALPPPQVLGALPCLRVLNLSGNKLRCLCGGLLQCRGLEELHLDDNYLTSIKGELRNLHCLRVLSASRNSIFSIEETVNELKRMHAVEVVDFRKNQICHDSNYALIMWRTLPSLSLLDGRGKFQDPASFAAVKLSGKQKKANTRKKKLVYESTICERFQRCHLQKVYLSKAIQTAKQENSEDMISNKMVLKTGLDT